MNYMECLVKHDKTNIVEVRELTETMAENLSEAALVISANFLGGKATVWRNRVAHEIAVDEGTIAELRRRIVWRDQHVGLLS